MNNSILTTIKEMLGLKEEVTDFDTMIIFHINSVFGILTQMGVGPETGFSIIDKSSCWKDYINSEDSKNLFCISSYVYLKVRLMFDPPTNSSLIESINNQIKELEFRMNVKYDKTV